MSTIVADSNEDFRSRIEVLSHDVDLIAWNIKDKLSEAQTYIFGDNYPLDIFRKSLDEIVFNDFEINMGNMRTIEVNGQCTLFQILEKIHQDAIENNIDARFMGIKAGKKEREMMIELE